TARHGQEVDAHVTTLLPGVRQGHPRYLAAHLPGHHAAAVEQHVHGCGAEPAVVDPVARRRRSTALDVPEHAHSRLEPRELADLVGDAKHPALLPALCHHDDARPLAALPALAQLVPERNEVGGDLGDEDVLGAARHAHA